MRIRDSRAEHLDAWPTHTFSLEGASNDVFQLWHVVVSEREAIVPTSRPKTVSAFATPVPGELFIVPKGVEHKPVAGGEVLVLLFEPAGTLNTGNVTNDRTVHDLERI